MTNQEYWLRTARVLVLVFAVAACSSDASTSSTTPAPDLDQPTTTATAASQTTTPGSPPITPPADIDTSSYGRLLEARDTGDIPATTLALSEFALQFGPVPGALDLTQDGSQPGSATGAIQSVFAVWDELDETQRSAVAERLRPWLSQLEAGTGSANTHRVAFVPAPMTATLTLADMTTIAEAAETEITSHLGGDLDYSIVILESDPATGDLVTSPTGPFLVHRAEFARIAEELGIDYSPTISQCTIVAGPTALGLVQPEINSALAHELFHCWSQTTSPDLAAHVATPGWYQEGVASWVGETFAGGSAYSTNWWSFYLSQPIYQLYAREYSAIGFWSWLDEEGGVDLWSAIPDLHGVAMTGDDSALFLAATQAIDPGLLTGLGAGRFRQASWGGPWDMSGPGIRGRHVSDPLPLPVGESRGAEAAAGTLTAVTFTRPTAGADQVLGVTISGTGTWRARWSEGTEVFGEGPATTERWCLNQPCECPDGTSILGYEALPAGADLIDIAATGGADVTSVAEVTVEDLCTDDSTEPAEPGDASALTGNWRATDSAVNRMFANVFEETEGATLGGNVAGDVFFNFDGSGEARLSYVNVVVPIEAEGIPFEMTVNGGGRLSYGVAGGSITFKGQSMDFTFTAFGEPITIGEGDIGLGAPAEVIWGLDGDRLTLQPLTSDTPIPNQWERQG